MSINILILILGMAVVTYLPRALPAFVIDRLKFGSKFEKFLKLIPFTAMTSLIVPSILTVDAERWYIGAIGGIIAIIFACFKKIPTAAVVLISVISIMLIYSIGF